MHTDQTATKGLSKNISRPEKQTTKVVTWAKG